MPSRSSSRTSRRSTNTTAPLPWVARDSSRLSVLIRDFASSTICRKPFLSFITSLPAKERFPSVETNRDPPAWPALHERVFRVLRAPHPVPLPLRGRGDRHGSLSLDRGLPASPLAEPVHGGGGADT